MECNKYEAFRVKEIAEKKFMMDDVAGAKEYAIKAKSLYHDLDGIDQMISTMDIHLAQKDPYKILSVDKSADSTILKTKYRKLVLQLHPDKNKSVGANGAFHFIKEAYRQLSEEIEKTLKDQNTSSAMFQQSTSEPTKPNTAPSSDSDLHSYVANACAKAKAKKQKCGAATNVASGATPTSKDGGKKRKSGASTPDSKPRGKKQKPGGSIPTPAPAPPVCHHVVHHTFWTLCNRCNRKFEYYIVYRNHNILCYMCREPFFAAEIPTPGNSAS